VYKDIAVIGLGTIGGFLAKNLSEIESLNSLVLIDYDIVEESNVKNSIYNIPDIGKSKVDCMYDKVRKINEELKVTCIKEKYIEGKTKIPKCDLVIDCRDFTYDRGSKIDVRLYLSSRYLIIDCRKDTKYQSHYEGKYIDNLSISDISLVVFNATMFITTGLIKEFITKRLVHKIELDYLKKISTEMLDLHSNKMEVVLDNHDKNDKLINLFENAEKIIDMNKQYKLQVCLGDNKNPLLSKIIPKCEVKDINELTQNIMSFINQPINYSITNFNHYVISPVIENKICYVILIPETGAA